MIRRLVLWWLALIDRETHGIHHARQLDAWRREAHWTLRELQAHDTSRDTASGQIDVALIVRAEHLKQRLHDLQALISEHA